MMQPDLSGGHYRPQVTPMQYFPVGGSHLLIDEEPEPPAVCKRQERRRRRASQCRVIVAILGLLNVAVFAVALRLVLDRWPLPTLAVLAVTVVVIVAREAARGNGRW